MTDEDMLSTLLVLSEDISKKIIFELSTSNDLQKIKQYQKQLKYVDLEIKVFQGKIMKAGKNK